MANNNATKPRDIECQSALKAFERNRYFYGKLLTVRDFEVEQRYFIEKQRLINRLIHGSGVVCGLRVEQIGDTTKIRIHPGVALDCCGREIVVPTEKELDLKGLVPSGVEEVYVLLKYDWCGKEPVPNVSDVSSCEETCCYSRIMESYKIDISQEMPEPCPSSDRDICKAWETGLEGLVEYWSEPCPGHPEHPVVVLAAIKLQHTRRVLRITQIDNAVVGDQGIRKQLVFSNPRLYKLIECVVGKTEPELEEGLTHITNIGWPHNESMSIDEFIRKIKNKEFTIEFSKDIKEPWWPDENTFLVALRVPERKGLLYPERIFEDLYVYRYDYLRTKNIEIIGNYNNKFAFLMYNEDINLLEGYFTYLNDMVEGGIQVLIQIKCDFIKDVNEKAVAGHHFFGQGKSGLVVDGKHTIPGGLFESWFYLK